LYDTALQKNYVFNAVAADIVRTIDTNSGITIEDVVSELCAEYQVEKDILHKDVTSFIDTLFAKGVLQRSGNESPKKPVKYPFKKEQIPPFEQQIQQKLRMATGNNHVLLSALLELTYRCNESCIHCYAVENEPQACGEISTQEWFSIIDQLFVNNAMFITLTGGEVKTRDDFLELIMYAIQKRFVVDIFSNGSLFSDDEIIRIASLFPRSFQCSIYGKPETHDSITQVPGSFHSTLHTLGKFHKLGTPIVIKTVLMKENACDYDDICQIAEELDATLQVGLSISAKNNGNLDPLSHRIESIQILENLFKKENKRLNYRPAEKEADMSICGAGFNSISINPYGDVFACNSLGVKVGSVKVRTVLDIWSQSQQLERFRHLTISNLTSCVNCNNLNYCQFCPGLALSETGNPLKPYAEACRFAKVRYNVEKGGDSDEKV
jgi:radical SAM protein with 4Fe4S-binding SPASM domain